jgi:hypothetical protein
MQEINGRSKLEACKNGKKTASNPLIRFSFTSRISH